ncbi:49_t:CDS:2, partial [Funneliformis caledonium]
KNLFKKKPSTLKEIGNIYYHDSNQAKDSEMIIIILDNIDISSNNIVSEKNDFITTNELKRRNLYKYRNDAAKLPHLNDKDADVLNKSLFYFKMTYEEVYTAKVSSFHIEAALNNFIKEQFDQIENLNIGSFNNKIKSFNKKQNF